MATFRLVPILQSSHADQGDSIAINLHFVGSGMISDNKLVVTYDLPDVLASHPGTFEPSFSRKKNNEENSWEPVDNYDFDEDTHQLTSTGLTVNFPPWFFASLEESSEEYSDPSTESDVQLTDNKPFGQKMSAMNLEGHPPGVLTLNIADDAPSGDYKVSLTFIYKYGNVIAREDEEITFHVNTIREKYEPWPTRIAVVSGIAVVLSLIYTTGSVGFLWGLLSDLWIWAGNNTSFLTTLVVLGCMVSTPYR